MRHMTAKQGRPNGYRELTKFQIGPGGVDPKFLSALEVTYAAVSSSTLFSIAVMRYGTLTPTPTPTLRIVLMEGCAYAMTDKNATAWTRQS